MHKLLLLDTACTRAHRAVDNNQGGSTSPIVLQTYDITKLAQPAQLAALPLFVG